MPYEIVRRQTGEVVSKRTEQEVRGAREDALVLAAQMAAIEYTTAQAQRSAVGIALDETLAGQMAPHAIERFRLIAEAGTQALVMKLMSQGRG